METACQQRADVATITLGGIYIVGGRVGGTVRCHLDASMLSSARCDLLHQAQHFVRLGVATDGLLREDATAIDLNLEHATG